MSRATLSLVVLLQIAAVVAVGALLTVRHEQGRARADLQFESAQLPAAPAFALPAPPSDRFSRRIPRTTPFLPRLEVDERALTSLPLAR